MIISVASGKGGTGKTTVAVNLALSLSNVQFLDCDVEEPNAHLFLKPVLEAKKNASVPIPEIDGEKCTYCGRCRDVCAYNAIVIFPSSNRQKGRSLIFPQLCHGCGACSLLCPQGAIKEIDKEIGVIEIGRRGNVQFVHGRLNIGEAMAPPLIRQVKQHLDRSKTVIIDAPPGTSCPVIAAIKESNYCLLVTEPTPFGLNDLVLAVEVLRKMQIPFGVIINRADLGDEGVDRYCGRENIPVIMRIPFSKEIAVLYSEGIPLVEKVPAYKEEFMRAFERVCQSINAGAHP